MTNVDFAINKKVAGMLQIMESQKRLINEQRRREQESESHEKDGNEPSNRVCDYSHDQPSPTARSDSNNGASQRSA
jgi:hypothetical protein